MMALLGGVIGRLPVAWLHRIGAFLGWLALWVLRVRRRVTLDNMQRAMGIPRREALHLAAAVYRHLCTGALELTRVGGLSTETAAELLGASGVRTLQGYLSRGRGLLVLSGHIGQWDLLACAAARAGLKVNVVTRQIKAGWLNRFWMAQRRSCGVTLLPAKGSGRSVLAALRRNEIVAMVLDQHEPGGLVVPFFGRPAATASGLARVARVSRAPVVPVFLLRDGVGYQLVVEPEVPVPRTGDRGEDVIRSTALFTAVLEARIRRNPEQWLWLHRRWKVADVG